jgi:hypothetical protein
MPEIEGTTANEVAEETQSFNQFILLHPQWKVNGLRPLPSWKDLTLSLE